MRNKTLLIAGTVGLLVLVLLGATFILPRISLPNPNAQQNESEEIVEELDNRPAPVERKITLSDEGFSPVSITVKIGDAVTFINESDSTAAVHSNPHPVHNLYEELNLGEFEPGKSLGVIFETPGTYSYHNHLNPNQQGTILVEE